MVWLILYLQRDETDCTEELEILRVLSSERIQMNLIISNAIIPEDRSSQLCCWNL